MACPSPGRVPGQVRGQQDLREVSCHTRRRLFPLNLVGSSLGDAKKPRALRAVEGDSLLLAPEPGALPQAWPWWAGGLGVCGHLFPCPVGSLPPPAQRWGPLSMEEENEEEPVPASSWSSVRRQRGTSPWVRRAPLASTLRRVPCMLGLSA